MIQLQVDFSLLTRFFGIPRSKLVQYANKDIDEIMKLEAEQGNKKAQEYKKILSNPDKILEIFKLSNPENKFLILQNMREEDLDKLLPLLSEKQLAKGLNFFTQEKLIELSTKLPIEELAGMIFEKFSVLDVLNLMQESSMDQFLMQPQVERRYIQKYFESLDKRALEKIMMKTYGDEYEGKEKEEYLEQIEKLNDSKFNHLMLSLEPQHKTMMVNTAIEQDEALMLLFKPDDLVRPMELLTKEDQIKMMQGLEGEFLVPMIKELPLDLTSIVLTQIDPRDFSEVIARDFQDILSSVVLFSDRK